eukprot:4110256-Pleurochrysis_carterae.AAC.1
MLSVPFANLLTSMWMFTNLSFHSFPIYTAACPPLAPLRPGVGHFAHAQGGLSMQRQHARLRRARARARRGAAADAYRRFDAGRGARPRARARRSPFAPPAWRPRRACVHGRARNSARA